MSETMTLEDLAPLKGEPPARVYVKKVDAQTRSKTSINDLLRA